MIKTQAHGAENWEPSFNASRDIKWYTPYGRFLAFSYKVKFITRPNNFTPRDLHKGNKNIGPHKDLYSNVNSSLINVLCLVAQLCPTLCNLMGCSLPASRSLINNCAKLKHNLNVYQLLNG